MTKLIDFIRSVSPKSWIALAVLAAAASLAAMLFSSCGISGRVQGTRKIEKSVIHEQQYDVGKDASNRSTVCYTMSRFYEYR